MSTPQSIKDKIQKLLNMSMSDNEHEAATAMKRAMKLMNEHNLTTEEVRAQPMIEKVLEVDWIQPPTWVVDLMDAVANSSGSYVVWVDGTSAFKDKWTNETIIPKRNAYFTFFGRERDVENSVYIASVLTKIVKEKIAVHRKKYTGSANIDPIMIGYRAGLILGVRKKLSDGQREFFNAQTNGKELVPVESKVNEAKELYNKNNNVLSVSSKSNALMSGYMMQKGFEDGQEININKAVTTVNDEKRLLKY